MTVSTGTPTETAAAKNAAHSKARRMVRRSPPRGAWLVPTIYIIFLLLPIYWLVNMSFKTNTEITGTFSLYPHAPTLRNYAVIFTDPSWYRGYINSIIYVALNTVISVGAALPAARATAAPSRIARAWP